MAEEQGRSPYLQPHPGEAAAAPTDPTRSDLLARKYAQRGWIFLAIGLIVPFLAVAAVFIGGRLMRAGRRDSGLPLVIAGLLVAGVRFYLYARTGFTSAW
jgi:hypothetical protein